MRIWIFVLLSAIALIQSVVSGVVVTPSFHASREVASSSSSSSSSGSAGSGHRSSSSSSSSSSSISEASASVRVRAGLAACAAARSTCDSTCSSELLSAEEAKECRRVCGSRANECNERRNGEELIKRMLKNGSPKKGFPSTRKSGAVKRNISPPKRLPVGRPVGGVGLPILKHA